MEDGIILVLVGIVTLIVLVLMGVHIVVALGTVGFFGLVICLNLPKAVAVTGIQAYSRIAVSDYAVIPLFILVGMLITGTGISTEYYDALAKWLGRIPGGLGVAITLGCTVFGTLNGSVLITGSVFIRIAISEIHRYDYNTNLTYGLIAASDNIGQFILPSILTVIFSALPGDFIDRLPMAAIAPGLTLAIDFSLFTVIAAAIRPSLFPRMKQRFTWKEKLVSPKNLIPVAIVAVVIIGDTFLGICSSAKAGTVGYLMFFLMGLIKRTPLRRIWRSIMDAVENMIMLPLIPACSGMFAKFITASGLAQALANLVTQVHLSPIVFIVVVIVVLLILGCFPGACSGIALTTPVFYLAAVALEIDPMQFDLMAILALRMGGLAPPAGLCVCSTRAVVPKDVDVMGISKGSMPYLVAVIVITLLFIFIPGLSAFIPNAMFT